MIRLKSADSLSKSNFKCFSSVLTIGHETLMMALAHATNQIERIHFKVDHS